MVADSEQQIGLYLDFFGFNERPFTLVPDPDFIYWAPQHRRAFSVLEFGLISRAPITMITGSVGSGKTTLLRELLKRIEPDCIVGLISNAQGGRGELIQWVLNSLELRFDSHASYVELFQMLQEFLLQEYSEGRRVVLIFDEAQNLSVESLEELRMLTNINSDKDELIQLVLIGQAELREVVLRPNLRQLAQRIAVSFHISPLDSERVHEMIVHRLKVAGGTGEEFTPEACEIIYERTHGVPRLVNQLCDMCLLYAWSGETAVVDAELLELVLGDGVFFAEQVAAQEAVQ